MKTALDIIGWVSIALGCMLALGAATSGTYLSLAIASAVSGLVFLVLGVIVEKLSEIEGHLRRLRAVGESKANDVATADHSGVAFPPH